MQKKMNKQPRYSIIIVDIDDVQNPFLGAGQAHATSNVGRELVALGHSVEVLCTAFPGCKDRVEHGIKYTHIGVSTKNMQLNTLLFPFALAPVLQRRSADVVIDCFSAPYSTNFVPLLTKLPVVGLPTSFEGEQFTQKYRLPFGAIEQVMARKYKYFLPYTQYYADKMKKYNPTVTQQIVPEGVSEAFFEVKKQKPEHVLFIGRFDIHQKGLDLLLRAWKQVEASSPYPLLLAGKGTDAEKLQQLISELKLKKVKIIPAAYGEDKNKLLAKAAFVVMPSRHEGFSLFSLEALATSNPLVVFDIPGFSWAQGAHTGVVKAPVENVTAYADNLAKLLKSKTVVAELAKDARATATKYSWKQVAQAWASFITTVLKTEKENL